MPVIYNSIGSAPICLDYGPQESTFNGYGVTTEGPGGVINFSSSLSVWGNVQYVGSCPGVITNVAQVGNVAGVDYEEVLTVGIAPVPQQDVWPIPGLEATPFWP